MALRLHLSIENYFFINRIYDYSNEKFITLKNIFKPYDQNVYIFDNLKKIWI